MFADSKTAQQLTCGATKATKMSACLGESLLVDVVQKLQNGPFTIMIDESNDHGANKVLLSKSYCA